MILHYLIVELSIAINSNHFIIQFLAFVGKCIKVDIQLRHQVNEGIYPAFGLKKFIEYDHFSFLQNTITTLKCASFITDNITAFFMIFSILSKLCCVYFIPVKGC